MCRSSNGYAHCTESLEPNVVTQFERGKNVVSHGAAYVAFGKEFLFVGAERNSQRQITCFFLMASDLRSGVSVALIRVPLPEFEKLVKNGTLVECDLVEADMPHNMLGHSFSYCVLTLKSPHRL